MDIHRCQGIVISRRPDELPLRRCARSSKIGKSYCVKHLAQEKRMDALRAVLVDGWEKGLVASGDPLRPGPARKNAIPPEYQDLMERSAGRKRAKCEEAGEPPPPKKGENPPWNALPSRAEARKILGVG